MGYLDSIINPELNPIIAHKRMLEENLRFHNENLKQKMLSDPTISDKLLSHFSREAMTENVAKKLPVGSSFEKAMAGIDKDDPRRAMLAKLSTDMPGVIKSAPYGEDPGTTLMKAVQDRSKATREDAYKFIQSRSGFFDKSVAPEEGYEEWEKKNPGWSSPITNALIGAGGELASVPILAKAGRMALSSPKIAGGLRLLGGALSMAPPVGPAGIGARMIGAGIMGATAFGALDAVKRASAAQGHIMGLPEELLASIPIFGGLNKLAKVGGRAVSGQLAGLESNLATDMSRATNTFTRAADGRLIPVKAVTGEDIRAAGARMAERDALREAEALKQESFRKLEFEDHDAILKGADPEAVMTARVKVNMEKDAAETVAKKEFLDNEILERATMIQENEGLDRGVAIVRAKELLAPTVEQTAAHTKILKEHGVTDAELTVMSARQRALNAETMSRHSEFEQLRRNKMLPMIRDEILPPAVVPNKVKPTRPLDIKTGLPIQAGMPERLGLPEHTEGALTKTLEESAARKVGALQTLRQGRIPDKSGVPEYGTKLYADEIAGNESFINIAKQEKRNSSFLAGGLRIHRDLRTAVEGIPETVSLKERQNLLNKAATDANIALEKHLDASDVTPTMKEMLRNGVSKAVNKTKLGDEEALADLAREEVSTLVRPMLPEVTLAMRKELVKDSTLYKRLRKDGTKEWNNIPDEEKIAGSPRVDKWRTDYLHAFGAKLGKIAGTVATGGLVLASTVFGGSEAEAASYGGGVKIPVALKDIVLGSEKSVEEMTAKIIEAGLGPPKISENGHTLDWLMRSMGFAPKKAEVFQRTRTNMLDSILSPGTRDEMHLNARYEDGTRAPFGIGKEVGYRSQVILANTEASLSVVKKILKDAGVEQNLDEISAHMLPLVEKYHKPSMENSYWNARASMFDDVLNGKFTSAADTELKAFSKLMKASGKDMSKLTDPEDVAYYNMIKGSRQEALDKVADLKPSMDAFAAEHDMFAKSAAEKWATARVAFAADGTGMKEGNKWLEGLLSSNEKRAAEEISALNRVYMSRMKETGHDTVSGPYMHHAAHPSVDYAADLKHLESFAPDGPEAMRLVNFFSRTAGSKLMIPDTHYIMGKYIPDANKRIEISDMWKMGKSGGWDDVRKQMQARGGHEGALKLIDDIRTAFDPMDTGGSAKWLNRYAAFEVARLLTLSPSVSFKHALKLMGNWTIFPAGVSAKASGENIALQSRTLAQDLAGTAFRSKDDVANLNRALTSLHHTYAAVSDMAPYELPVSAVDKFLTKWNQLGSAAVNGVERWDRGQTFISAMMMAQKRGMTPEQAMFGLMDSVLKVNFLTGPNNPKWLKDPFIRTMMLFQGTPFKILEQRAMLMHQGGKDMANTLKLLGDLRKDVKTGEANFKWNMLNDEFTRNKDVYGTPYTTQFLKQLLVLGTVIGTGKMAFDSNLWGHAIHIPGTQLGERGINLGVNPIVGAAYKTVTGGNIAPGNEDEFALSRFLNTWMGGTGFPAIAHKMARLRDDDIPAIYKDSKLSYLFGVPRSKEK